MTYNMKNNGLQIGKDVVKSYFGGYFPKSLKEEGFEINSEEEIYALVEQMESYYVNLPTSIDPYDESDIEKAHEYVTNWVKTH